ncbi:MAG: flagellar filament capping protein FliD [Desulfatibacillum sp.]|nr:flagellar filament capping protein FliD [Desulfatibacillum sp.]
MNITGTYSNYLTMSSLLAPLGSTNSGAAISNLFSSVMTQLQDQLEQVAFSQESSKALSSLYIGTADLAAKAGVLTLGDYGSVFFDRTAASSDANVLTAQARNAYSTESGAAIEEYAITVENLASGQKNTGTELANAEATAVDQGIDRFKLIIEDTEYLLEVKVDTGETNYKVLGKIAEAINANGLGVTAQVTSGNTAGTSALQITADQTGSAGAFLLADVTGNAIAATGANTATLEARDSAYTVNGEAFTSSYNNVYLDGGKVAVGLYGTGEATLSVGPDTNKAAGAAQAFVNELNVFMEYLKNNENYIQGSILNSLTSFIGDKSRELQAYGITQDGNGYLQMDVSALNQGAAKNLEGLQDLFAGVDGLAARTATLTSQISSNLPLTYAKEASSLIESDLFGMGTYNSSSFIMQSLLLDQIQGTVVNTYA